MYTVKSISNEGVYYLWKGWGNSCSKHMWEKDIPTEEKYLYKTVKSARTSVTKLLKVMDEYKTDKIEIIEV